MKPIIKYSKRKSISLSVDDEGLVVVKAPLSRKAFDLDTFLFKHQDWILKRQSLVKQKRSKLAEVLFDENMIESYKAKALEYFKETAERYSQKLNVKYKRLRLSNAKKRWGSCSTKGTVSLNWRLYFTPRDVQEYVVLHELMHLRHMNHSKRFWKDLAAEMPNYREKIKYLKKNDYLLLLA